MTIRPDTKISALIKANTGAIEAIASINPHFNKLRNPLLRKILASRVTISEAARIGKCSLENFAEVLRPLGFELVYNGQTAALPHNQWNKSLPYHAVLDVRKDLENGKDPFNLIMEKLHSMKEGETLLLVNSFVPVPLIKILERKKHEIAVQHIADDVVHTFITIPENTSPGVTFNEGINFDEVAGQYKGNLITTDVRNMPMPQPMIHILEQLQTLPAGKALFVHHKKIPKFLLPELTDKGYQYAFKEGTDEVLMLIFKDSK